MRMKSKKTAADAGSSSFFLQIGSGTLIRESDIIGIFDTDSATASSPITKKYLSEAEKNGDVEADVDDIPKSFVLYRERTVDADGNKGCRFRICFSELSSSVILQRSVILL